MKNGKSWLALLVLMFGTLQVLAVSEDTDIPPAVITNDEGGTEIITGNVTYTNGFFTLGVDQPLVILEDQTGFVTRNRGYDIPIASQVLGQITSDFFTSPFTYSITLPERPNADLNDVDHDGEEDQGVVIYAIAYWTNIWGDPYLEERDLFGGGWSSAYVSTRINPNSDRYLEYDGGTVLVWSPDDAQAFPSGFGDDTKLFTDDDPLVMLPAGYTLVNMDTPEFTFDRSATPTVDLIEGEGSEADDFSAMSYTEAFDAMLEKYRNEYAYTELKQIDWDAKSAEFRPRFEQAEADSDINAYALALRDFIWSIPDAHLSSGTGELTNNQFLEETDGGLGMAIRRTDDGNVIVNYVLPEGPADAAGIDLKARILSVNGVDVNDAIIAARPWSLPFSTEQNLELQQLRYVFRFPVDTSVEVEYQNPGDTASATATLTTIAERDSFRVSSFSAGLTGYELPVEYQSIPATNYVYARITSFADNDALTISLWERMIDTANANGADAIIIDMRQNGGGSGWLADQMAAYFFDEPLELNNSEAYDKVKDAFISDPDVVTNFILPPVAKRWTGKVAVLVGPACSSACEYFSYDMTLEDRAAIVGQYATGGLAGGQEIFFMPEDLVLQLSIQRSIDADGNPIIEGVGVVPTVKVPVDEETLFFDGDVVLDAAVTYLDEAIAAEQPVFEVVDGGTIEVGTPVEGTIDVGQRVNYAYNTGDGGIVTIKIETSDGAYVNLLSPEGDVLADGTSPTDPGWEDLELPPNFDLVLEVVTEGDAGAGSFTLSVVVAE